MISGCKLYGICKITQVTAKFLTIDKKRLCINQINYRFPPTCLVISGGM